MQGLIKAVMGIGLVMGLYGPTDGCPTQSDDVDGDGYAVPEDCNDLNASVYPGATESCDGLDTDCNGFLQVCDVAGWESSFDNTPRVFAEQIRLSRDASSLIVGGIESESVTGELHRPWVRRVSLDGNVEMDVRIDDGKDYLLSAAFQNVEGDITLGGSVNSGEPGALSDHWWAQIPWEGGSVIREETYGGDQNDVTSYFEPVAGNDTLFGGYSNSFGDYQSVMYRVSLVGYQEMAILGPDDDPAAAIEAPGGGYIVAGHNTFRSQGAPSYFWIQKVDAVGGQVWFQAYDIPNSNEIVNDLIVTSSGDIVMSVNVTTFPEEGAKEYSALIIGLDSVGNIQWNADIADGQWRSISKMLETPSGEFMVVGGQTIDADDGSRTTRAWLAVYDHLTQTFRSQVLEKGVSSRLYDFVIKSDGTAVAVGYSAPESAPSEVQGMIFELDSF